MKMCSVGDCGRVVRARGFCTKHYTRFMKHGDPLHVDNKVYSTPEESFAARTEWQGDCLIWTGGVAESGHGRIWFEGNMYPAHRYAWERVNGKLSRDIHVDHKDHCNRACVNVSHLREVTTSENNSNRSGATKASTTGIRNVYITRSGRFEVKIKKIHFGTYETPEEAERVAYEKRKMLFGEFAGKG